MNTAARLVYLFLHEEKAEQTSLDAAIEVVRKEGHEARMCYWSDGASLRQQVRRARSEEADVLVAAGGDGSLRAVADALCADGPPSIALGVLPLGTGNDFATACGIPSDDPVAALRLALYAEPQRIDLGRFGDHFFINAASGGFGAEVTAETSERAKKIFGRFAYLLTGLLRMTQVAALPARVTTPSLSWEGDLLGFIVANGRSAGGGFQLTPTAMLNDGVFDVVLFPDLPPGELADLLTTFLNTPEANDFEQLITCRAPWIEIEAETTFHLNLDGEPCPGTSFRFEVAERYLPICLPADTPLL